MRRRTISEPLFLGDDEIIVDNFAGGGGASAGIERAFGRPVDVAINHDPEAIAMHAINHPRTRHYCESVFKVDPVKITEGKPVALAWFSPDCKHFSKAKGGRPVEKKIRGLAWVVIRWARRVKPRVIMLENVEEFQDWGPLTDEGLPCPLRKGKTFVLWLNQLRAAGYKVEYRELRACDYGAPTIRKRLFVVARRDGLPIVWPEPTHGPGRLPYRTAAECIDWSILCPSIFERTRPLAENTLRRIARGVMKYVVNAAEPFIVPVTHAGDARSHPVSEPMRTVTTAQRGEFALVSPLLAGVGGRKAQSSETRVDRPYHTTTAKADTALVAATLVEAAHGEVAPSGAKRWGSGAPDIQRPLGTVAASGGNHALVGAVLVNTRNGERDGQSPRVRDMLEPHPTITSEGSQGAIAAAFLAQRNGHHPDGYVRAGRDANEPLSTVVAGGPHQGVVAAFMAQHNTGMVGHDALKPVSTIVGRGTQQAVVAAMLSHQYGGNTCGGNGDLRAPHKTVTTGGHHSLVRAFLMAYYGTEQDPQLREPMHTQTTKDRFGLVTVKGELYEIVDIGMRMLVPRELFRAQGFPDSYVIAFPYAGKPLPKTAQVRMCGNSVPPALSEALAKANLGDLEHEKAA